MNLLKLYNAIRDGEYNEEPEAARFDLVVAVDDDSFEESDAAEIVEMIEAGNDFPAVVGTIEKRGFHVGEETELDANLVRTFTL